VKRLTWIILGLLAFGLAACAPTSIVSNNVVPTLVSATVPAQGGTVVLQGRYFGDGQGGAAEDSYVLVGANMSGDGGIQAATSVWTPTRIEFSPPQGAGSGFVFVIVAGVRSNGLPINLP